MWLLAFDSNQICMCSKLSLFKSEIKDCISENFEFRDCTFSVKTVKLFLLFCRCDFTVFRSIYGEKLSVAMSLSSLLLRIFIKLLTCVPPYGFKTSALAVVSTMRINVIRINEIDEKVKIRINLHLRTWCDVYYDNKSIIMS